jgi:two-component system phosphate regulon sensor histidine kinase PhoR
VSHELRTPLTVINGFLETMADMPDLPREQAQQFIGLMQKEGARMQTLLADLLTLSRLESGVPAEQTPIDLSSLAESLSGDGDTLSAGKHEIHTDIAPDIWISGIYADLYNGLSNLVFNAVRYTPAGGIIRISLQALPSEQPFSLPDVRFAVQDNGPGIAPEHIPHLTERFYRVDKGRSRQSGGTGLGLAIVKHALAEHNSLLHISSTIGEGSEFSAVFKQIVPPARR